MFVLFVSLYHGLDDQYDHRIAKPLPFSIYCNISSIMCTRVYYAGRLDSWSVKI